MTPFALARRIIYRLARQIHKVDVRRNRSAGSKKGWQTRRKIQHELNNQLPKESA